MSETTEITLYTGVNIPQAVYMAAFSQPDGLQSIIEQIKQQAAAQAEGLKADTAASQQKAGIHCLQRRASKNRD